MVPLVSTERRVYEAKRAPEREAPPALLLPLSLLGLVLGGALAWWGRQAGSGSRAAALATTGAIVVWLVVVGIVGGALVFLRTMTAHVFAYDNTNVFVYSPLWLLLVACLPLARGSAAQRRFVRGLAIVAGGLTAFGLLALFVPGFNQHSLPVALLAAPANLVAAWIIRTRAMDEPAPTGA
jgi:hypothetical protein